MKLVLITLVKFYRFAISPMLGKSCRFYPTCSEYAMESITRYGSIKGFWLAVRRIFRCHPFSGGGYDPIP